MKKLNQKAAIVALSAIIGGRAILSLKLMVNGGRGEVKQLPKEKTI